MPPNRSLTLVVGGNGFLGRVLVETIRQQGGAVRVFDRAPHADPQIESVVGDIRDAAAVEAACEGVTTVFQNAAVIDWQPGSEQTLYDVNVRGNHNVIEGCVAKGVRQLVYTSSIDVVYDGRPIRAGDETLPYPRKHLDQYSVTKTQAERDVIAANGRGDLLTCSIRPMGIFGPNDRVRLPNIIAAARNGEFMYIGDGSARYDHVYVDNVAQMHIQAAEHLLPGSAVAGQCYFATDEYPTGFVDFFAPFLKALDLPLPTRRIPFALAYAAATASEWSQRIRPPTKPNSTSLTRYIVTTLAVDCYVRYTKATRDFGYMPSISRDEAIRRTTAWLVEYD